RVLEIAHQPLDYRSGTSHSDLLLHLLHTPKLNRGDAPGSRRRHAGAELFLHEQIERTLDFLGEILVAGTGPGETTTQIRPPSAERHGVSSGLQRPRDRLDRTAPLRSLVAELAQARFGQPVIL